MSGAPNESATGIERAPGQRAERRGAIREATQIAMTYRSTLRFPRGESGHGVVAELSGDSCKLLTDRPLESGQWVRLDWTPTLRDRHAMSDHLRPLSFLRVRITREIPADGPRDRGLPYEYGASIAVSPAALALAVFDLALPWIGLLLILATSANVIWLRGGNLYYFWYHPVMNLYGLLISGYILSRVVLACFYAPPRDAGWTPEITVALACKNEEDSIGRTLACVYASDYPPDKLQVIAVDDGSTDGTWAEMERARERFPALELIRFDRNLGKRHGMAAAARQARGEVVVYVDSDSFVRPDALYRIVQGFADPEVAAVCGHAAVENATVNFLTKMQEVRYYVAFRIVKAAESLFSTVTCCSGCLAAYRRGPLMEVMDVWLGQRFLGRPATFGDDRSLTNFMLRRFRVIYDSTAVCSTIVPSSMSQFFRQQLRWKKSWIRESLLASLFMWKRHPLAAFYFYLGVIFPLVSPAVVFAALVMPLAGLGEFSYLYIYGTAVMALLYGLVYLVRHKTRLWFYGLLFSIFYMLVLVWQTYYALVTVRRNHWGTR